MTKYDFVVEWFKHHPNQKFTNSELERRLREDYEHAFGGEFRDPLREARKAHEKGVVLRSPKGPGQVYWYEPNRRK